MADLFAMVEQMRTTPPGAKSPPAREPWRSVGERAMTRGKYSIAQYGEKPGATYALYGDGPAMLGKDADYRVLMELADKLDKGE